MHKYLKAAGFGAIQTNADADAFLYEHVIKEENLVRTYTLDGRSVLSAYRLAAAEGIGIEAVTERFPSGREMLSFYYPYFDQTEAGSKELCVLEEHLAKETFGGCIDDYKLGISLIFFVSNPVECLETMRTKKKTDYHRTWLSGFSAEGRVLLPIEKQPLGEARGEGRRRERDNLIEAAREGDEKAIEILTDAEMDTYSEVMKRVEHEDLYSIVESSCIPSGVECDLYSVLGEIMDVGRIQNAMTGEKLYVLKLDCNDVLFPLLIREADLFGEPEVGRRFKGKVWLQGRVDTAS